MEHQLFGGAICGQLPADALDMSDIREIPDNQEVFAHPYTDQSLIVEILEFVDAPDDQALRTHFEDIALTNDASGPEGNCIESVQVLDKQLLALMQCSSAYYLVGKQIVSKFQESSRNTVNIHMVLFRLPQYASDILLTLNDPIRVDPESSSHQAVPTGAVPWTVEDFKILSQSLCVLDTNLFGH